MGAAMAQVCLDGRPLPIDLTQVSSIEELRYLVADVLDAPAAQNVEFLDEDGCRLNTDHIEDLGHMNIQTFPFGMPESIVGWASKKHIVDIDGRGGLPREVSFEDSCTGADRALDAASPDRRCSKLKFSLDVLSPDSDVTTHASSEQGESPSRLLPLHEAVSLGDLDEVLQLVADEVDVDCRNANCETPLHRAAWHGRLDLVNALLQANADPMALDKKGKTPLRKAYDNQDVAMALLAAGSDPNIADRNGTGVLHRAAEDDHVDVVRSLLVACAKPDVLSLDELTPLHAAAISGSAGATKLLLESSADVHLKGAGGNTALHFAAYGGHEEVGRILLEAGADASVVNEDGETPFQHGNVSSAEHALTWLVECDP